MATLPETMKAVIFDGPYAVSVQDRAVPKSKRRHSPNHRSEVANTGS